MSLHIPKFGSPSDISPLTFSKSWTISKNPLKMNSLPVFLPIGNLHLYHLHVLSLVLARSLSPAGCIVVPTPHFCGTHPYFRPSEFHCQCDLTAFFFKCNVIFCCLSLSFDDLLCQTSPVFIPRRQGRNTATPSPVCVWTNNVIDGCTVTRCQPVTGHSWTWFASAI